MAPSVVHLVESCSETVDVPRVDHDPRAGPTDECGRIPGRRYCREDRAPGRQVLEDLSGNHWTGPAICIGYEQEQGVGVALQRERDVSRDERDPLHPLLQPEGERVLPVAQA